MNKSFPLTQGTVRHPRNRVLIDTQKKSLDEKRLTTIVVTVYRQDSNSYRLKQKE
jgi:hypothetical protein